MKSKHIRMMLWEILKPHQMGLILVAFVIPLLLKMGGLLIDNQIIPSLPDTFNKLSSIPFTLCCIYFMYVFSYSEFDGQLGKTTFPNHLFRLPLKSRTLAMVPNLAGFLTLSIFVIFWQWFINEMSFAPHQYLIIVVCSIIAISLTQFISWRYGEQIYHSVFVFIFTLLLTLILAISAWQAQNLTGFMDAHIAYLGLFLESATLLFLTFKTVQNERCHIEHHNWFVKPNFFLPGFQLPKAYHSKTEAHFRFEWRVFGWVLPLLSLFILAVTLMLILKGVTDQKLFDFLMLISAASIYTPCFMQFDSMKSQMGAKTTVLNPFLAIKPLSNFQLALGKLKMSFLSMLLFQAIVLIMFDILIFNHHWDIIQPNLWHYLLTQLGLIKTVLIVVASNLLLPFITWAIAGNVASWALNGRPFYTLKRVMIMVVSIALLIWLGTTIYNSAVMTHWLISHLSLIGIFVLAVLIALVFFKLMRFTIDYKLGLLKNIVSIILILNLIFLSALWSLNLPEPIGKLIAGMILGLSLLTLLAPITSPFSVKQNRSR